MFVQLICQRCRCIEETVVPKANIWNMNYNDLENDIKYLNATKTDMHFGVYVNTVGIQIIKAGEHYPLKDHPSGYFFNVGKGRVLQEFQLLYITKGAGSFTSDRTPKQSLTKGALLCLFPGQWHTYSPSEKIGRNEYYIGFNGPALRPIIPCSKSVSMPSW